MEQTMLALISKLDPSSIMLALALYGAWRLVIKVLDTFQIHAEKVTKSLESIAEDTSELRKDIAVIAARVDHHDTRIHKLESR